MEELNKWLEEKRREILDKHYNQYSEGYLDAIMDVQNKIKSLRGEPLSNYDKLKTYSSMWVAYFILYYSTRIYRNYTDSLTGIAQWFSQPADKTFWENFEKDIGKNNALR